MEQVEGKVAVVTGGASGIGLAMARRFAADGMRLVLADIEEPALHAAAADLRDDGAEVLAVHCDVAVWEEVEGLRDAVLDELGAVHVVCNNAGVGAGGLSWELPIETWRWVIGIDLFGVIHGIKAFVPHLVAQNEGHIINTASAAGLTSTPGMAPYNAAKHGVVTISEDLHAELRLVGATGVGVSVLCPGFVRTRIHESHRNAPDEVVESGGAVGLGGAGLEDMVRQLVESGLDPDHVADLVAESIRDRRFYVLPHPEVRDWAAQRVQRVVDGEDPVIGFA